MIVPRTLPSIGDNVRVRFPAKGCHRDLSSEDIAEGWAKVLDVDHGLRVVKIAWGRCRQGIWINEREVIDS